MPDDCLIIDRALVRCSIPGEEHTLYIILYNLQGMGTIEIFSGIRLQPGWEWESVCLWHPEDEDGQPVVFHPFTVVTARQQSSSVIVSWVDGLDPADTPWVSLAYDLRFQSYAELYTD